jgi:hypothetical protein
MTAGLIAVTAVGLASAYLVAAGFVGRMIYDSDPNELAWHPMVAFGALLWPLIGPLMLGSMLRKRLTYAQENCAARRPGAS